MSEERLLQIADALEKPRDVEFSIRLKMAEELRSFAACLEANRRADVAQAAERAAGYDYGRNNRSRSEG